MDLNIFYEDRDSFINEGKKQGFKEGMELGKEQGIELGEKIKKTEIFRR